MGYRAKKRLGQNFLNNTNIIAEIIAEAEIKPADYMIEIGPGLGALTAEILKITEAIEVIEYDQDLITPLRQKCHGLGTINITHQDVLTVDFKKFCHGKKMRVIGNLPYNIASLILFHLVQFSAHIEDMYFMLQKEVVERITASRNNKNYGRLSIMMQYHFICQGLLNISKEAFWPKPKVESQMLRLTPFKQKPYIANNYLLFKSIVKHTFQHRRKTLNNTLKLFVKDPDVLKNIPVDTRLRPENLSVANFVDLSNYLERFACQPM